jgi:predicted amidohydrolase
MRVGFVQFAPLRGAGPANIDRAAEVIGTERSDLWVLPELITSGYLFADQAELLESAEEIPHSPSLNRLKELSRNLGSAMIAGFPERHGQDIFNSAVIISRIGDILGVYRKIQLFDCEKILFSPGDRPPEVWEIEGARVGVMICFDWIFPEVTRSLALQGADIIAHPANLVLPHCPDAMQTRCIENRVFAVTANRVGEESVGEVHYRFIGRSQVVNPSGIRLIAASEEKSTAMAIDIDISTAQDKNITKNNHIFLDRRPELYRLS